MYGERRTDGAYRTSRAMWLVGLLVVAVAAGAVATSGIASAATLTVDDGGGSAYTSIQTAVNDAAPGDTIEVQSGTYDESVNIPVENLTLRAADGSQPVINSSNGPVLQINAPNVTVEGFTVTGATGSGASGHGINVSGHGVVLRDLEVVDNDVTGVAVDLPNDDAIVGITGSTIGGGETGLNVSGADGVVTVRHTDFQNNVYHVETHEPIDIDESVSFDAVAARDGAEGTFYGQLQPAIDDSDPGESIIAGGGPFDQDVLVNKPDLTVTNLPADTSMADVTPTIDGRIEISAPGVTVDGLHVTRTGTLTSGGLDPRMVLVTANHTVVRNTAVSGIQADSTGGSTTVNGIQIWSGSSTPVTNVTVENNEVSDVQNQGTTGSVGGVAGIKTQGNVDDVTITGNEIADLHSAGWVYGIVSTPTASDSTSETPEGLTVRDNVVTNLNDGSEFAVFSDPDAAPYPGVALGVDGNTGNGYASAGELTVRENVFAGSPVGVNNKDPANTLDATENYWGTPAGPSESYDDGSPVIIGADHVTACPYYPTDSFDPGSLRNTATVTLDLTANQSTPTAGAPVAFELTDAATGEPVDGTVNAGGETRDTGPDGTAVFTFNSLGSVTAEGNRTATVCNAFEADSASVTVQSAGGGGGGGGGGAGGITGGDETDTPTGTETGESDETETSDSDGTVTSTDEADGTTATPTDTPSTPATGTDETASPTDAGTLSEEPGGLDLGLLFLLLGILAALAVGLWALRSRGDI